MDLSLGADHDADDDDTPLRYVLRNDFELNSPKFGCGKAQCDSCRVIVGGEIAATKGQPFRAATDGETVSGKFTGTAQLSSGKFAMVEQSHEFTLVSWRPVIDRQLGREVMGIVQGRSVSWQLGKQRAISL